MTHAQKIKCGFLLLFLGGCSLSSGAKDTVHEPKRPQLVVQMGGLMGASAIQSSRQADVVAVGDGTSVVIWQLSTRAQIRSIWPSRPFRTMALDSHGKWLAVGLQSDPSRTLPPERAGKIEIWNVASGKRISEWYLIEDAAGLPEASAISFSDDASKLAIASDSGSVWILTVGQRDESKPDTPPVAKRLEFAKHGRFTSLAFNRQGDRLFAQGSDGWIGEINPASGKVGSSSKPGNETFHIMAIAPEHPRAVIASKTGEVALIDLADGKDVWRKRVFDGKKDVEISAAVVSDSEEAIAIRSGSTLAVLDSAAGNNKWSSSMLSYEPVLAFAAGSNELVAPITTGFPEVHKVLRSKGNHLQDIGVWDARSGHLKGVLESLATSASQAEFFDREHVLVVAHDTFRMWSLSEGRLKGIIPTGMFSTASVSFSGDFTRYFPSPIPDGAVLSRDGTRLAMTLAMSPIDGKVEIRELKQVKTIRDMIEGKILAKVDGSAPMALDPAGNWVAVCRAKSVELWTISPTAEPKLKIAFADEAGPDERTDSYRKLADEAANLHLPLPPAFPRIKSTIAVSRQASHVAIAYIDGDVVVHELKGKDKQTFEHPFTSVHSVDFSTSGDLLAVGCGDGTIHLWPLTASSQHRALKGHTARVASVRFDGDGKRLVSSSADGTVKLWDIATSSEIASLLQIGEDGWIVASPDGRFDTDDLDELESLHWVFGDDPMRSLPAAMYMRDYFEPRLLSRLLNPANGKKQDEFPPLRPLQQLNRARPVLTNLRIEPNARQGRVDVLVDVAGGTFSSQGSLVWKTGAYDLRLFRDGQMIAQFPDPKDDTRQSSATPNSDDWLRNWRNATEVVAADGRQTVRFAGMRLPRVSQQPVVFSAYAFNEDRIKSDTLSSKLGQR